MGETEKARDEYDRARDIFADLAAAHPEVPKYREPLAISLYNLGNVLDDLNRPAEAEAAYRRGPGGPREACGPRTTSRTTGGIWPRFTSTSVPCSPARRSSGRPGTPSGGPPPSWRSWSRTSRPTASTCSPWRPARGNLANVLNELRRRRRP